jgi:hypothetical protein
MVGSVRTFRNAEMEGIKKGQKNDDQKGLYTSPNLLTRNILMSSSVFGATRAHHLSPGPF